MQWAAQKSVALVGLDYKDQSEAGKTWLARFGNPYSVTLSDLQGKVGIDLGVYGVPETFLIDAQGIIRYKHVGPLTPEVIEQKFMTLIRDSRG
jgi:cytochrome c biogenesis protein CcmG/thiol:disulfide interchange protein DsbE